MRQEKYEIVGQKTPESAPEFTVKARDFFHTNLLPWLLGVISFFVPIAGLAMYLAWKEAQVKRSKYCFRGMVLGLTIMTIFCLTITAIVATFFVNLCRI